MPLPTMLLALLVAAGPTAPGQGSQRLTLTGTLKSEAGAPVKGATVFVHTAGPRQGTSSTCPSCYLDCRKKAQSDAQGGFRIESLDPRLRFSLLVIARGYKARIVPRVDPLTGPHAITLTALDLTAVKPDRVVKATLLLPSGRPAVGAVVEVNGVRRGNTTRFGGTDDEVDPVAVTDARGELVLLTREPVSALLVRIEAPGVARRSASLPSPGPLRLTEGVTVSGRVVDHGKPVGGVVIGMVTESRRSETFLGDYEATTQSDGRFTFRNMPPHLDFLIYGKMESFGDRGVPATVTRTTGDDRSTLDVGDIAVGGGRTVAGRIVLGDGKPIPEGTRLGLYRQAAWDMVETVLPPDGSFRFRGVPPEEVSLSTRLRGYVFSLDNPNVDWRHRTNIEGQVDRDIDNLTLLMEPGEPPQSFSSGMKPPPGVEPNPGETPLRPAKPAAR